MQLRDVPCLELSPELLGLSPGVQRGTFFAGGSEGMNTGLSCSTRRVVLFHGVFLQGAVKLNESKVSSLCFTSSSNVLAAKLQLGTTLDGSQQPKRRHPSKS